MAKKIFHWCPSARFVSICAALALVLLLVPLFRIAEYAVPWYDDLNYGGFAKASMTVTPGIGGALRGAVSCVRIQWYIWQGTYASIFFMTLMPGIWGEEYYFYGPVFLLLLLLLGVFTLMGVLVRDVFQGDRASCLTMQSAAAAMVIVLMHSSQSGIYWYNAGIHYVGMHSFFMLYAAALVHLLYEKRRAGRIFLLLGSMAGAVLVAGSNYVTALQGGIVLVSLSAFVCFFHRKKIGWYLPVLIVYAIGFQKNAGAPGNAMRSANYVGWGCSPLEAVLRSFLEAFRYLGEFTGWITVAVLLLLIPIIWRMAGKSALAFRFPGLFLVWSFCLYASGFTPSLYSLGHGGLGRTLNAVKITCQLLLVFNEIYWLGWLRKGLEAGNVRIPGPGIVKALREKNVFRNGCPWWYYGMMGLVMLFIFSQAPNQAGCYSSYGAYYYVHTGEAYNFYQEYLGRLEVLKGDEKDVVFAPYRYKPWLLCMGDLYEDPDREENRAVAAWYDKDSVVVREEGASVGE